MKILVTGAAGFIASSFVRLLRDENHTIVAVDKLTYAGNLNNIQSLIDNSNFFFEKGDISDSNFINSIFQKYEFDAVVNFAAESHVDNSIGSPLPFIETNIMGTFVLLEKSRNYWQTLSAERKMSFRYLQISTDEVFGTLGDQGKFSENSSYQPNSPYSASKAGADHLVRAWYHTYGLPTLITNCSNNYGPRQHPEKLIPLIINRCLQEKTLPVYGTGQNVRDWIHVEDHCRGVYLTLTSGAPGTVYCFGGNSERKNIDVVKEICKSLNNLKPRKNSQSYLDLISFVDDRKGHDWRYAIDDSKAEHELAFNRKYSNFESGLVDTIKWYLENMEWSKSALSKKEKSL